MYREIFILIRVVILSYMSKSRKKKQEVTHSYIGTEESEARKIFFKKMRIAYPKGSEESQRKMSEELDIERIIYYLEKVICI
jgi:hypothetical protein